MIRSKKHLSGLLKTPFEYLEKIAKNPRKYYYTKTEVKTDKNGTIKRNKNGTPKVRVITPAKGKLKQIQKLLNTRVLSQVKLHDSAYGGIKGRDNIMNAKRHKSKPYKFLTDLKDFFPSITASMVYDALINSGFSYDIARIITKLTTYKNQLPQGTHTSTTLSNIVMIDVDEKMHELSKKHQITYTRFVDDMTFSSQKDFKHVQSEILQIIKDKNLKLSHRKTYYTIGSTEITGARVPNNALKPTDALKEKLKNKNAYREDQQNGHSTYANRLEEA